MIAARLLAATIDPEAYKPQIEQAVYRATGRTLTVGGRLRFSPWGGLRIKATAVSLSNLPDGTRPQMVTVGEVKAHIAIMPLFSGTIVIESLELIRPDILLEITAAGEPNWRFTPVSSPAGPGPPAPGRAHQPITIQDLRITDGTATWLNAQAGQRLALGLNSLTASAPSRFDPVTFAMTATAAGTVFKASGQTGSVAWLDAPAAANRAATWPIKLDLAALGVQAALSGTIDQGEADPATIDANPAFRRFGRYSLALTATAQDLSTLAPLAPGLIVPPLRDLHVKAALTGVPGGLPDLRQLDLSAGRSDLARLVPGLVLDQVSVADPSAEAPIQARAAGSYQGAPFTLAAELGAPEALRPGVPSRGPFPISFSATAAGARLTGKGGILQPRALRGLDLAVEAQVPSVGAFAALLHRPLPDLKELSAQAKVGDGPAGILNGVTLSGLHVAAPGTDVAGDLTVIWASRPAVTGHINAARINAGDLNTAFANPVLPPPAANLPGRPAGGPAVAPPLPAAATAAPPPNGPRYLIPDRPFPLAELRAADADLQFSAAAVTWPDEAWRNLTGHLVVSGGKLLLDPFAAESPAGHLQAALTVDASQINASPTLALTLRAPGVSLGSLFALLAMPPAASGRLEVDASLHGVGRSAHEVAATADGSIGLAMVGGIIDGGAAQAWLADVLRRAALPDIARLSGRTDITCLALRLDMARGIGTLRALALQTPLLTLTGSGGVNLADETLAMRVRAVASVGIGIAVPFDVGGPFRAPRVKPNIGGVAGSALAGAAGLMIGRLGGGAADLLGGPSCPAELPIARGGRPGPLPVAAPPPPPTTTRPAGPARQIDKAAKAFRWLLP